MTKKLVLFLLVLMFAAVSAQIAAAEGLVPGDANGDNIFDGRDVVRMMKVVAGEDVEISPYASDVTDDAKISLEDLGQMMGALAEDETVELAEPVEREVKVVQQDGKEVAPKPIQKKSLDPVTLTVFVGDPGDIPAADNKIYQLIKEELGVDFQFEFLTGNLDETLGLKIAGGDLPDLFSGGNSAEMVIDSGSLVNLLDFVSAEKTPRLWAHIQSQKDRLIRQDENGKDVLYIIPNYGITDGDEIVNSVGGPAFFIQKQVLEWAGYPQIKTLDDYFDVIERFIAANPTDDTGAPYTGFSILCEDWRHFCLLNPVQHLMGRPNDGEVLVDVNDPDYHTETFIDKPYAKPYYKKLNEEYWKGIISADTFTQSYDEYIESIARGNVLGMFDQAWDFGTATAALIDSKMYGSTYVALGLIYDEDDLKGVALPTDDWKVEEHYINGNLPNVNRGFGISVDCADPERVVAMWEELMSDEWQLRLNWGIEGEDYYIDENGRLNMTEQQLENTYNAGWKLENKADALFSNSPKKQGYILNDIKVGDKVVKAGNCWEPGNQPEIVYDQMTDYDKEFLKGYGYSKFSDFLNAPVELPPYGEAWQIDYMPVDTEHNKFMESQDKWLPQIIMSDSASFDAKWDAFVTEVSPNAKVFGDYMQREILNLARPVRAI